MRRRGSTLLSAVKPVTEQPIVGFIIAEMQTERKDKA